MTAPHYPIGAPPMARGPAVGAGHESATQPFWHLKPIAVWRFLRAQPASFWFINLYLMIEYVRPQQVWTSLDVLPWGQTAFLLAAGAFLLEGKRLRMPTALGGLLVVFSGVVLLSSFTAINTGESIKGWSLYFSWVAIYLLITNIVTTERRFFLFLLAFLLYSFKMSQHGFRTWLGNGFGFSDWGATGAPGWFHNSGEFGVQMCVFLPLSVEFILAMRPHWNRWVRYLFYLMPITAVASMVASSSRGALVGGGAVALWWVVRSKQRVRSLLAITLLGVLTWAVVPPEQKARFSSAGEDDTSTSRIERWTAGIEMANDYPVLGIGYNNWLSYAGPLSHNIFIEAWSELGYTGLFSFLALIAGTFIVNAQTRRLVRRLPTPTTFLHHAAYGLDGALIGYMASGFFVTVLYYPYFWINLAMTVALHVSARHTRSRILRSPANGPGPLLGRHGFPRGTGAQIVGR